MWCRLGLWSERRFQKRNKVSLETLASRDSCPCLVSPRNAIILNPPPLCRTGRFVVVLSTSAALSERKFIREVRRNCTYIVQYSASTTLLCQTTVQYYSAGRGASYLWHPNIRDRDFVAPSLSCTYYGTLRDVRGVRTGRVKKISSQRMLLNCLPFD